jgi:hypothetical protein
MRTTRPGRSVGVLPLMFVGIIAALAIMALLAYNR